LRRLKGLYETALKEFNNELTEANREEVKAKYNKYILKLIEALEEDKRLKGENE
jgi:hypothetical protein